MLAQRYPRRSIFLCCAAILLIATLATSPAAAQQAQPAETSATPATTQPAQLNAGAFSDETHLRVVIAPPAGGGKALSGTITRTDHRAFPFEAQKTPDGSGMTGSFKDPYGNSFEFNAELQGDDLVLHTGQATYMLRDESKPLPPPNRGFGFGGFAPGRMRFGARLEDGSPGQGVLVGEVFRDTPAARAGVRTGDRIVEIESKNVRDMDREDLRQYLRSVPETYTVGIIREGKLLRLTLTRPDPAAPPPPPRPSTVPADR